MTGLAVFVVAIATALIVALAAVHIGRYQRQVRAAVARSDALGQRLQTVFDDAPIGMALVDRHHRIVRANHVLRAMLGTEVGNLIEEAVLAEDAAKSEALMERLLSGAARRLAIDTRLTRPDGSQMYALVTASGVTDGHGNVVSVITHVVDRTERQVALNRVRDAEARFRHAFAYATTGMAIVGTDGHYLQVNPALCAILGRTEDGLLRMRFLDVRHPEDRVASEALRHRLLRGDGNAEVVELRFVRPGGEVVWGRTSVSVVRNPHGEALYFVSLTEDITAERRAQEDLRRRRRWFEALVEHGSDIICVVDANGRVKWASPSAVRLLGYDTRSRVGVTLGDLIHPEDRTRARELFLASVGSARAATSEPFEVRLRAADGSWRHFETIATNLLLDPDVAAIVTNSRDITERVQAMAQVRFQALHDPLTGVGNRHMLLDRLDEAVRRLERSGVLTAVLFIDLDGLKALNDVHGHGAGDRMLIAVAGRLAAGVQPGDTVARLGGDEFVVLARVGEPADAMLLAERLRVAVGESMVLDGIAVVQSTASIGVAVAMPGATTERLLHDADVALYRAKHRGKNRCELAASGAWPDVRFAE